MWTKVMLIILLAVNVLLVWAILFGEKGLGTYRQQQAVLEKMQAELRQVREDNVELSRKIRLLKNDKAYLEQRVRTRLHYVRSNEIMYLPGRFGSSTSPSQ
ncbi:MAG: septum formation initiator family protein [Desulfovermiculus sp.]